MNAHNSDTAYDSTTKIKNEQTNFMRDAFDYVDGMTAGWNLGNTLDAHSHSYSYGDITVDQSEHLWRKENFITSDLFDLVVEDFNTIRIPITWNAFINPDNDYAIDEDYMDRIQEVVDMCYKAGFEYIIINTQHDSDYYFNPNPDNDLELGKYVLKRVWEQIGERFADYDEKLIFESMNEIRSMALDWSWSNWSGNSSLLETYNEFNKVFYSTVRNTGGNNGERYLMLQTYGGMRDSGHFKGLWLPDKSDDDHIIASFHWYIESQTVAHYTGILNFAKNYWIDKGIPCVIGETGIPAYYINGVLEKYDDEWRENWVNVAFGLFEEYNIKAIVWDDHGTYSNTYYDSNGKIAWKFPKYVAAIKAITAKQGSSGGEQDTTASSTETSTEPTTQTTTATTTTTTTVTSTTVTTTQPTSTVTTTQTTTATTTATATSTQPTTTERKFIYGDTNADGVINTKDVLLLRKHLAKWDVTIDADAADCNADGKVNTKDLLLLRKYLARWDVFLGKA